MFKYKVIFFSVVVVALWGISVPSLRAETLRGKVNYDNGKPLEGVAVSARAVDKPFTTTVYTNQDGAYAFPALGDGHYKVWAQAVGFEASTAEQDISAAKTVQQNFTLKAAQDFSKQLNGDELITSLPGNTPKDLRLKAIFAAACTGCHQSNFTLQNRFDAHGWTAILDFMTKTDGFAAIRNPDRTNPAIEAYRDEIVEFLTKVRGPSSTLDYKLVPRPTGEAAQAVITEFDLTLGSKPDTILEHNGTIWSEGTPAAHYSRSAHDVAVDQQGNVWFADQLSLDRTIGKLDPKTGKIIGYKLAGKEGTSVGTHGIITDAAGSIWFTNSEEGTLTKFDPKAEQFTRFPRPDSVGRVGGMIDVDSKGNIWAVSNSGAVKLDPKTAKYTDYRSVTPGGNFYGFTVDAKDNAWFTQLGINRLGIVDSYTGEVNELVLKPREDLQLTEKDREIATHLSGGGNADGPDQKGPRRLGADKKGEWVWVAEFYSDSLARININTKAVKEYPMLPYSRPYTAIVDKNHMVWVAEMNADRVAKFDPNTEKFTEYLLPSRGTETRAITLDNSTDPPSVWLPYYRANKLARVQVLPRSTAGPATASLQGR